MEVKNDQISTHAPAGGATQALRCMSTPGDQFLLTPLREGRLFRLSIACFSFSISTHAPAGGATRKILLPDLPCTDFYSRPCGRGDLHLAV